MSEQVQKEGDFKVKAKVLKPKQLSKKDKIIKVDLSQPKEKQKDAIPKRETKKVDVDQQAGDGKEVGSGGTDKPIVNVEKQPETVTDEKPIIEEVIEEPVKEEEIIEIGEKMDAPVKQDISDPINPNMELPENIEKLVDFMKETGGTVEDYVRLNADYSNIDNDTLLKEYYKNTKSHLDSEEIKFMIEDNFSYQEIKLRPGVTQEQKKATDFFNRYNEGQDVVKQQHEDFKSNTKNYFTNEFKGFDFQVGDKKFRYGVKNVDDVADKQSNISNTIKKFLNDTGGVVDVQGYHKAIYAADNADSIAQHFYEQGKSDAVREISAKSNNITTAEPRSAAPGDIKVGGYRIKSVSGLDSSKLKIKKSFN